MGVVIRTEGLGKKYQRGAVQGGALLRDQLSEFLRSPLSLFRRQPKETFWALKNVSLEVHEEALALIWRNGAGKTTLLKLLSRITRPTTGWADIYGRVGSLLEVGTGFHPELTGRENTFLIGAILGMTKLEITGKFDEIVAFAELEKFIDTPVKHYSSSLYVPLAFAVAHWPHVVLVSHQLDQIRRLCNRVVWIDDGQVRIAGNAHEVVSAYETAMARRNDNRVREEKNRETKENFIRWEIDVPKDEDPYVLKNLKL